MQRNRRLLTMIPPVRPAARVFDVLASMFSTSRESSFEDELKRCAGRRTVELFGSGRAALAQRLLRLERSDRDEVLVPAYTCWSVPAAVVRANLKVRLVDVDPVTLAPDAEQLTTLPTSRLEAIVVTHLFADTCDVDRISDIFASRDPNVLVIEDAAQCWPTRRPSRADAVVLSFGRGKPMALGGGGALLHDNPPEARPEVGAGRNLARGLAFLAALVLSSPRFFRIAAAMPGIGIGETIYDPQFPVNDALSLWQRRLGAKLLAQIDQCERARGEIAAQLRAVVSHQVGWHAPGRCWLKGPIRLPLLAPTRMDRDRVVSALRRDGVYAGPMYPGTLADIQNLRPHLVNPDERLDGARALADRLLTIPVYPMMSRGDVDHVGESLLSAFGAARP
ncbi:MAG: DegT/DnrJ/EryC1/StrS aminotransferase family protein [Acidobacteriota bacterium]|nr:MAG: DegT/DnrJ/EryC1/StrS aminotransferase family protein [Acidobacteriota bacterium]